MKPGAGIDAEAPTRERCGPWACARLAADVDSPEETVPASGKL
jgi:hypothetical protein